MTRTLTYEDRCALTDVIIDLRGAEFSLIVALRSTYASTITGALRTVRADVENVLKKIDAAEALFNPQPKPTGIAEEAMLNSGASFAEATADPPLRLVPRFETAPEPTAGDAA